MPTVYVYNALTKSVEKYMREIQDPMPYVKGSTMTVAEFLGGSNSTILWTDKSMLDAWNAFRTGWGKPLFIGYAFKRIWEGGHTGQSQHYAGLALDFGQTSTQSDRTAIWNYAVSSGVWTYVEPLSLSQRWIHVDKRYGTPACPVGGFPMQVVSSRGVYVFVLQDALTTLGYVDSGLDGVFGSMTARAVGKFQTSQGIAATGVVDCATWTRLTTLVNGMGASATTIR